MHAAAGGAEVSVANSGPGSIWEAATTLLGKQAGVGFKPVPFDGGAPAGLPQPVTRRLRDAVAKAAQSPGFTRRLTKAGAVPTYHGAEEFTSFAEREFTRFADVLRPAGS
ncbi:hypothetical protein ABGB18_28565 [Nonomuraea sp. B12E4]|uniref:hypothetical protein n=1 Tax=Nonomuraea sp. B12E4 TaxID=3153564 RepID=UPI00325DE995